MSKSIIGLFIVAILAIAPRAEAHQVMGCSSPSFIPGMGGFTAQQVVRSAAIRKMDAGMRYHNAVVTKLNDCVPMVHGWNVRWYGTREDIIGNNHTQHCTGIGYVRHFHVYMSIKCESTPFFSLS